MEREKRTIKEEERGAIHSLYETEIDDFRGNNFSTDVTNIKNTKKRFLKSVLSLNEIISNIRKEIMNEFFLPLFM